MRLTGAVGLGVVAITIAIIGVVAAPIVGGWWLR